MALTDILTAPLLISLGITLLLVGLIGMFFMQRLQEQNHKISSMFGLVTTMAEEMNYIRSRLQATPQQQNVQRVSVSGGGLDRQPIFENNLIPVSDGENEDDSDDDSEPDLDESEDDEDEEDEEDDEDEDDEDEEDTERNVIELLSESGTIKVINFGDLLNNVEEDANSVEELNDQYEGEISENNNLNELDELHEMDDLDELDEFDETASETNSLPKNNSTPLSGSIKSDLDFIKTIDISNLEETSSSNNIDYKKFSLNKLKEVAVSKGLIGENSKATKNAILKMLGSE